MHFCSHSCRSKNRRLKRRLPIDLKWSSRGLFAGGAPIRPLEELILFILHHQISPYNVLILIVNLKKFLLRCYNAGYISTDFADKRWTLKQKYRTFVQLRAELDHETYKPALHSLLYRTFLWLVSAVEWKKWLVRSGREIHLFSRARTLLSPTLENSIYMSARRYLLLISDLILAIIRRSDISRSLSIKWNYDTIIQDAPSTVKKNS